MRNERSRRLSTNPAGRAQHQNRFRHRSSPRFDDGDIGGNGAV
jgi:hypothetical protein